MRDYKNIAAMIFLYGVIALGCFFFFKYLFPVFLPFIIGRVIAEIASQIAKKLSGSSKVPPAVYRVIVTFFIFLFGIGMVYLLGERLVAELKSLSEGGLFDMLKVEEAANRANGFILKYFPSAEGSLISADRIYSACEGLFDTAIKKLPPAIFSAVSRVPQILLFLAVTLLSSFYFGASREESNRFLMSMIPRSQREKGIAAYRRLKGTVGGYIKAYFVLFLITFTVLFVGFSLLSVSYSFVIALICAAADILPLIGVGTALVPWGLFELFVGNGRLGFGLLILFAVATVIREIAEPRILGKSLGIHPLLTLFALYSGAKLFGIGGVLFFPFLLLVVKSVFFSKKEDAADVEKRTV